MRLMFTVAKWIHFAAVLSSIEGFRAIRPLQAIVTPTIAEGSKAYLLDFSAPLEMTGRVGFSEFTSLLIGTAISDNQMIPLRN